MTHTPLPWSWLKAAFHDLYPPATPTIDRAAQDEAVAFNAIVAHWDDILTCNMLLDEQCPSPALWSWYCECGEPYLACPGHRVSMDEDNREWELSCMKCRRLVPEPIPWLPL